MQSTCSISRIPRDVSCRPTSKSDTDAAMVLGASLLLLGDSSQKWTKSIRRNGLYIEPG